MIREIVKEPSEILHKVCKTVRRNEFNSELHKLLDDMTETLRNSTGIGLAAPQVGVSKRVVVIIKEGDEILELVNPKIIWEKGESYGFEGCLSVPGQWGKVTRPEQIKVRYQDRFGEKFEVVGEELTARCLSHELEHLDGHLFIEHIDRVYTKEEMEQIRASQGQ